MFSKILVKLIDESIVPAVLLLATRIISVVLISDYFNVNYSISGSGFSFVNTEDYIIVNTYSIFFMVILLSLGLFYNLIKAYSFHNTHISPEATSKLFSLKLSSFIQSSFDLYSQGSVWLSYSYLLLLVTGLMALFGLLYPWVFFVSLVLTLLSSILLIIDVEHEIVISKGKSPKLDGDTDYLQELNDEEDE